jgi:hypothetical protein
MMVVAIAVLSIAGVILLRSSEVQSAAHGEPRPASTSEEVAQIRGPTQEEAVRAPSIADKCRLIVRDESGKAVASALVLGVDKLDRAYPARLSHELGMTDSTGVLEIPIDLLNRICWCGKQDISSSELVPKKRDRSACRLSLYATQPGWLFIARRKTGSL